MLFKVFCKQNKLNKIYFPNVFPSLISRKLSRYCLGFSNFIRRENLLSILKIKTRVNAHRWTGSYSRVRDSDEIDITHTGR